MFCRIFALDVRRSLLGRWKRFSVALLFFVLVAFACKISFSNAYLQSPQLSPFTVLTLGDFLLYAFGGCDGVRSASLFGFDRPFAIPFQWLLLILLAIYINFDLTEESSAGVNVQLLLRASDKKQYWLSKILCITISTSLYFMLGVIVTLGCGFALGGVSSLEIDKLILNVMNLSSMIPREATSPAFIPTLLMVWFAILTITLLQQLISLFIKPIGSFLVMAVFLFLSAYFMKPFFFGNYAMMIRNALLCEGGVDAAEGILILSLVSLASIVGGLRRLRPQGYFKQGGILMFLEVKNVTKSIHGDVVIKNVSLCSERGRVIGLRGINGSGKTMLMRLISGLIRPTKGQVLIDGEVVSKDIPFPKSLGVLIEGPAFLDDYSAMDNLKLIAYPKGKVTEDEIRAVLSEVRLDPKSRKKYKKFSLGMKQRLGIAAAVMEHPDLILLDEPTNALDESGVDMLGNIVKKEKERGAVLIVSSHDRDILEDISDEIYDLEQGEIVRHSIKGEKQSEG